ncbi:MAG: alpha/beta fold hydrolase [Longimicrobiales bacterium]|nr:alpha/beta fold hydrolase [Longimicrobiales bacterium]
MSVSLHVEEHGSGGRPLVLVHGFGGHGHTWRFWTPRLAASYRVFLVDLKGHGASPKPDDDRYSPFDQAELLVQTLRARSLEDATLVGHSLGGGVVLAAALQLLDTEPGRVRSLVLVSAATRPQEIPRYIGWARKPVIGRVFLRLVPPRLLMRWALRSIVYDPADVTPEQIEAYAEPITSWRDRRALLKGARQIVPENADEVVARYGSVDVPTLLLWGREDTVVPVELGRELERTLPKARLEVVEECGHLPQEERPQATLNAVLDFLDERLPMDEGQGGS